MIKEIAKQIKAKIKNKEPKTLIILGSGLGGLADDIKDPITIPYKNIKGFPQSTVAGHQGKLIIGTLVDKEVICMQGRFHLYEGYPPQFINTIIKAFQVLGIKNLIVTNAAGSINPRIKPGSIMVTTDHINMSGQNPLIGTNDDTYGPRFPDLSDAYNKEYRKAIIKISRQNKVPLKKGVYLMVLGPNFETAAEIRAFRTLKADAIGMSTVVEVLSAVHSGMKVLGLSVITNFGTGIKKGAQSHEETLAQGAKATENLKIIVKGFIKWMT